MKVVFTYFFLMFAFLNVQAQPTELITNKGRYNWVFGLSWVLTDDDGEASNPFLVENLHTHFYPSKITVEKYIDNGWSTEAVLTYSSYNDEKITNDQENISGSLSSIDFHWKYLFYKLLNSGDIDPYIASGIGISARNNNDENVQWLTSNLNIGLALNFWIPQNIGIQLNSTAKIGMKDLKKGSGYMQHSIGVVVRFKSLKNKVKCEAS